VTDCICPEHFIKDKDGYPRAKYNQRTQAVSRLIWYFMYGPIPNGKWILHHCDNPGCVNPQHLYLGDYIDNNKDKADRKRVAGSRNPRYKITDEMVADMWEMYNTLGYTQQEIANRYSVSQAQVSYRLKEYRNDR
jgi:hypothetical protein